MFDLDHSLAQEIADRAMAILPRNVNVMDSQGLIIGTGEAERLYTRHEGAQLVLANNRAVEIDSAAASALRGVQEGVNLPLCLEGQLIGVIGVSGEPEEVRTFAEMVRMTAEMLVAQRNDQRHQIWLQKRTEDVLSAILLSGQSAQRAIVEAQRLGLKPDLRRTAILLDLANPSDIEQVTRWIQHQVADAWCVPLHASGLVWCPPRTVPPDFPERVTRAGISLSRVAIGTPNIETGSLRSEVEQLSDLMAYAQAKVPDIQWLDLAAHRIQVAVWRYRSEDGFRQLAEPYLSLQQEDGNGQLRKTLKCWVEHGSDGQACAEALNIHRNSLRYRLERIADITGFDLASPKGITELYLAMILAAE
ncbi:sugar diacid recognition domain-containing protein (plasmid) [Pseudomonas aeruginosa]|uniref:sugar diacid recognition domain-containing protein n=1 Tax=Pseudomonas aeruginosa TaxID=287 RepID=UPI0027DAE596|nr:sugar diacid recognition domain-containing protein [Pseudomonas aeruginosa]WMI79452.1 sugar diacid recognition domain-containing protein [Pseudomonas aeruginosa]